MNEKDISSSKAEDLSTNSDATDAGDNTNSERPKHDALIRKAFENPIVAKEFFEMHLPSQIKAMFSSHTLKMEKESFIEADLKHSISDILFSAKFKDDTGYLWVLLEHQVINVHDIPDDELKKKAWAGILQFFMKHIHERDLLKRWYEVADLLPELAKLNIGIDYLELILTYTLIKIEKSDKIELEKILKSRLNNQQGEKLMTSLAHHWQEEGVQQGMQIGRNEGNEVAKNMYNAGSDIVFISKVTGLSISELNDLLKTKS